MDTAHETVRPFSQVPDSKAPAGAGHSAAGSATSPSRDVLRLIAELIDETAGCESVELPRPAQLVLCIERLRRLVDAGDRVSVILTLRQREHFDAIQIPGQVEVHCEHHDLHMKAVFDEAGRVIVLHSSARPPDEVFPPAF